MTSRCNLSSPVVNDTDKCIITKYPSAQTNMNNASYRIHKRLLDAIEDNAPQNDYHQTFKPRENVPVPILPRRQALERFSTEITGDIKMKDEWSEKQAGQDGLIMARITSSNLVSNEGDISACRPTCL